MRSLPLSVAIVVLLAAELWTSAAGACSCRPPAPPEAALAEADLVFEGRTFASSPAENDHVRWEFEVIRYWKGEPAATVTVISAADSAMCGRNYEPGTSYLVYADQRNDHFSDNLCSRTRPVEAAAEDLDVLGEGHEPEAKPLNETPANTDREPPRVPTPPREPPPTQPGPRGCGVEPSRTAASLPWILTAVAIRRRRAVASPNPTR